VLDAASSLGWREQITAAVGGASSRRDAAARIAAWLARVRVASSDPLDAWLYETSARAWMGGNLFVRDVELEAPQLELRLVSTPDFFSLPFEAAIDAFLAREIVPASEAFDALGRLEQRSFAARRLAAESVARAARDAIGTIMREGGGIADFVEAVHAEELTLGLAPSGHGYLRTVFETSTSTAYSAGRDRQLAEPAVIEQVPYRVYRAVIDGRSRRTHAAFNGMTWDARKTSEWRRFQGPNGFLCRCSVTSAFSADEGALSRTATHPDTAFDQPPTLDL
jgi:hypothetical protein